MRNARCALDPTCGTPGGKGFTIVSISLSGPGRPIARVALALGVIWLIAAPVGARQQAPAPAGPPIDPATDPAFDAALPSLEQIAPPAADAAPPPPAVTPADPELARPLVPLATFDATPPAPTAAQVADREPPPITYAVTVLGLKEVALDDEFKALSALQKNGRKAANATQVQARADEDVKLAERLLRSRGYYDGIASVLVEPVPDQPSQAKVTLTVTPGARYALAAIALTGMAPEPEAIARGALALKRGDPIVATEIEGAEARVAIRLPEQGYPFAKVGARDVLLDDATHTGDYTLPVSAGAKGRFGTLRAAGDPVFDAEHLAVFPRFRQGDIYDARKVDDVRQALIGTSLFATASVEPVATGIVGPDGTEQVDLLVRQTKGPWRSLAGSGGYGTGEGVKLTGSFTHRNAFPPEGALSFTATAGTLVQSLGATFRRSNAGKRDRTATLGAEISRERFAAYDAETATLSGSIARASTPIWQKRWTYSYGFEIIGTRESRFLATTQDRNRSTYLIAALPLQLGYDTSDSLLDPTKGFRIIGRFSSEAQKRTGSGGFQGYGRVVLEGSTYYPVLDSLVIAGRARIGSIVGAPRDSIAPSRRLYAGGGGSVRGFGYQELGPKDVNNDPVGGRSLTEFALEARYRFGNFGVVPFVDAGRVGVGSAPSISGLRYGAGLGGRYYTNFGPLRVDVATPIARKPGESRITLYISIGQAF